MELRLTDRAFALAMALLLLAVAAFVLFVIHPGGFEGQVGWFLAMMPGAIVGLPLADRVFKIAPGAERIVLWSSVISVTLLWYFVLSYVLIKALRFLRETRR